jgi:hypothetical protein
MDFFLKSTSLEKPVPENFEKIIHDLTNDLTNTFPEYQDLWKKWTTESFALYDLTKKTEEIRILYQYCLSFYPEKFFDILYNNEDIFKEESLASTLFLPNVDFKILFNCNNVSDKTRKIMWNYLQLILMTVIGSIDSKDGFGNSTKQLFEGIDEKDLFEKLNETMESMSGFFQSMIEGGDTETNDNTENDTNQNEDKETPNEDKEPPNDSMNDNPPDETDGEPNDQSSDSSPDPSNFFEKMKGLPNVKDIYSHLKSLFDGKIGSLAKELTEEIAKDMGNIFGEDTSNEPTSTKDVIQKLLKNPEKMTELIKTVSEKLNNKISKGEISQDELLKEATEIMNKMKGMGDTKQFQEMFKNISKMSGLGSKAKFDMNAFQQKSKQSSTREKLKEKMLKKRALELEKAISNTKLTELPTVVNTDDTNIKCTVTDTPNNYKFSIGEGINKDEVTPVQALNQKTSKNSKKKNSTKEKK